MPGKKTKIGILVPPGSTLGQDGISAMPSQRSEDSVAKLASKQRRRGPHVHLNLAICAAADEGVEELLQMVQSRRSEMNLVNFSTALHRLARIVEEGRSYDLQRDCRFQALLSGARSAISSKESECKARCMSTIAWSTARLGVCNAEMMQEIADLSVPRIKEFKPHELGILLWSFAKLQIHQVVLFSTASDHIFKNLDEFAAPCLATVVWSFATAQMHSASNLVRKAADAFALRIKSLGVGKGEDAIKPVALENMIWGLATLQVHIKRQSVLAIVEATVNGLEHFKVHEFTITLWAFARLGIYHDRLFSKATDLVQRLPVYRNKMHPQGIANLLWAFAKCAEKDGIEQFVGAVSVLLPTCKKLLPSLKPQELGCVLCSLSKLGKPWGENREMDQIFVSAASASIDHASLSGFSFQSVVNLLGAYARFTQGRHGTMETISTFVSDLLCLCPRFEAKFDAQSLLTIIEALPTDWSPNPRVELALDMIAAAALQKVESFPQPCQIRLATVAEQLPGERWSSIVKHMQKKYPSSAQEEQVEGEDPQRILSETVQLSATASHTTQNDIQEQIQAYGKPEDVDWSHEMFCPAYVSVNHRPSRPPVGYRREEPAYVNLAGEEPAYVKILEGEWLAPEDQDASLVVLNKIKPSGEAYGRTSVITFEVTSKLDFEMCRVKVDCHYDNRKYHSRTYCLEVGNNVPNTQTLCLTRLPRGMHEIRFYWQSQSGRPKFESFCFHVERHEDSEPRLIRMKSNAKSSNASCSTGIASNPIGMASSDEGEAV
jgi:hypothetical protein